MPFASQSQARYFFAKLPALAKKLAAHTKNIKALPERASNEEKPIRLRKNKRWRYEHELPTQQEMGVRGRGGPARFADGDSGDAGNERVRAHAKDYIERYGKQLGLPDYSASARQPLDIELGKRTADAYAAMVHNPSEPRTRAAFSALRNEIIQQYRHLIKHGVRFEPWLKDGQPYQNSKEMRADVANNNHLWFFPTVSPHEESSYGASGGDLDPKQYPLLERTGHSVNGYQLTVNDMFRAVHDYYGHAKEGFEFGPEGEYNAFLEHAKMFSPQARLAVASETHGQNSWVNFGKHIRRADGTIPRRGDADFVHPAKRPYAEQKTAILPDAVIPVAKQELASKMSKARERITNEEGGSDGAKPMRFSNREQPMRLSGDEQRLRKGRLRRFYLDIHPKRFAKTPSISAPGAPVVGDKIFGELAEHRKPLDANYVMMGDPLSLLPDNPFGIKRVHKLQAVTGKVNQQYDRRVLDHLVREGKFDNPDAGQQPPGKNSEMVHDLIRDGVPTDEIFNHIRSAGIPNPFEPGRSWHTPVLIDKHGEPFYVDRDGNAVYKDGTDHGNTKTEGHLTPFAFSKEKGHKGGVYLRVSGAKNHIANGKEEIEYYDDDGNRLDRNEVEKWLRPKKDGENQGLNDPIKFRVAKVPNVFGIILNGKQYHFPEHIAARPEHAPHIINMLGRLGVQHHPGPPLLPPQKQTQPTIPNPPMPAPEAPKRPMKPETVPLAGMAAKKSPLAPPMPIAGKKYGTSSAVESYKPQQPLGTEAVPSLSQAGIDSTQEPQKQTQPEEKQKPAPEAPKRPSRSWVDEQISGSRLGYHLGQIYRKYKNDNPAIAQLARQGLSGITASFKQLGDALREAGDNQFANAYRWDHVGRGLNLDRVVRRYVEKWKVASPRGDNHFFALARKIVGGKLGTDNPMWQKFWDGLKKEAKTTGVFGVGSKNEQVVLDAIRRSLMRNGNRHEDLAQGMNTGRKALPSFTGPASGRKNSERFQKREIPKRFARIDKPEDAKESLRQIWKAAQNEKPANVRNPWDTHIEGGTDESGKRITYHAGTVAKQIMGQLRAHGHDPHEFLADEGILNPYDNRPQAQKPLQPTQQPSAPKQILAPTPPPQAVPPAKPTLNQPLRPVPTTPPVIDKQKPELERQLASAAQYKDRVEWREKLNKFIDEVKARRPNQPKTITSTMARPVATPAPPPKQQPTQPPALQQTVKSEQTAQARSAKSPTTNDWATKDFKNSKHIHQWSKANAGYIDATHINSQNINQEIKDAKDAGYSIARITDKRTGKALAVYVGRNKAEAERLGKLHIQLTNLRKLAAQRTADMNEDGTDLRKAWSIGGKTTLERVNGKDVSINQRAANIMDEMRQILGHTPDTKDATGKVINKEPGIHIHGANLRLQHKTKPKRFAKPEGSAEPFYSHAERIIQSKMPNSAHPDQVRKTLLNNGVKPDEMKWSGIDEHLANAGDKVSKGALLDHLQSRGFKVKPVWKGGNPPQSKIAEIAHNDMREFFGRHAPHVLEWAEPFFDRYSQSDGMDALRSKPWVKFKPLGDPEVQTKTVPYFPITPAMREHIKREGQARFKRREQAKKFAAETARSLSRSLAELNSVQQTKMREVAARILHKYNLVPHRFADALHDTATESKPGIAQIVLKPASQDSTRRAAAQYGLISGQNNLLVFHGHPEGPDSLYGFDIAQGGNDVRKILDGAGLTRRTLLPTKNGFRVLIHDAGRQLRPQVESLANSLGVGVDETTGFSERIGGKKKPEAGKAVQMAKRTKPARFAMNQQMHTDVAHFNNDTRDMLSDFVEDTEDSGMYMPELAQALRHHSKGSTHYGQTGSAVPRGYMNFRNPIKVDIRKRARINGEDQHYTVHLYSERFDPTGQSGRARDRSRPLDLHYTTNDHAHIANLIREFQQFKHPETRENPNGQFMLGNSWQDAGWFPADPSGDGSGTEHGIRQILGDVEYEKHKPEQMAHKSKPKQFALGMNLLAPTNPAGKQPKRQRAKPKAPAEQADHPIFDPKAHWQDVSSNSHINTVWKVQTPDDKMWFVKKAEHNPEEAHTDPAARKVLRELGFDEVPPTETVMAKHRGKMVKLVAGPWQHLNATFKDTHPSSSHTEERFRRHDPQHLVNLLTAEHIIHAMDRNPGNYGFDNGGKIIPLDYGESWSVLPWRNEEDHSFVRDGRSASPHNNELYDDMQYLKMVGPDTSLDKSFLQKLMDKKQFIRDVFEQEVMPHLPQVDGWEAQRVLNEKFNNLARLLEMPNPTIKDLPRYEAMKKVQ